MDGAAAKQWVVVCPVPMVRKPGRRLGPAPAKVQLPGAIHHVSTTNRSGDEQVASTDRPVTHLVRARGLEPLTRRLDVDVATSAHPDQPRMLAASTPPCQPTPDRPPARQVQAKWRPVVSQATCTPVLSSSWSDGPDRMIGGDAFNARCPSSWLARLVALSADGWLACFDGACSQRGDHLVGGGFGHLDQREPVGDLNRADVATSEPRFASNGPD